MKEQLKDIAVRAFKTFVQTFVAVLLVADLSTIDGWKAGLLAGVSAGVSAVWNTILAANAVRKS
jgi:hypothetical protein